MTRVAERTLDKYMFPVVETDVYSDEPGGYGIPHRSEGFKAIRREDNGKLIAIHRNSYKLVPNRVILEPLLEQLERLDTPWLIEPSHSFVSDERMRLQIRFPELFLNDGRSNVDLSLFVHNSYNGSEGFRLIYGAIRAICSNGMIFGEVLKRIYRRHTSGFSLENLNSQIMETAEKLPLVSHRIEAMQETKVTKDHYHTVEKTLGMKISKYIEEQEEATSKAQNLYVLFNLCTWYVSHRIHMARRADYQMKISKIFQL